MATDPRAGRVGNGYAQRSWEDLMTAEDHAGWMARSRVFLMPIAAPSIMGLFGFALVLEHSFGRSIIPVGKWSRHANVPGAKLTDPIEYPAGMPGVKVGQ